MIYVPIIQNGLSMNQVDIVYIIIFHKNQCAWFILKKDEMTKFESTDNVWRTKKS